MTVRTKRRRRLTFLLVLGIGLAATGAGLYAHQESKLDAEASAARAAGLDAFEEGAYARAVTQLGKAIGRLEPDPLTLRRYAQAIYQLPDADPRHIGAAVAALRQCTQMAPDDEEARRALLKAYIDGGALTEAVQLAKWFLDRDAADSQALLTKARALTQMRRFEEALAALLEQVRPATARLEEHLLCLSLMGMLKKPAKQIHVRAERVMRAHPADRRFRLVGAHAHLVTGDDERAREGLRDLLGLARGDAAFARLLRADLDAADLPRESLALLKAYPNAGLERDLRGELVRRLWEAGEGQTLPERVAAWSLSLDLLSTSVLGYLTLTYSELGRTEEAHRSLEVLAKRERQDEARAWGSLLRGVTLAELPSVRSRITACRDALEADPNNAPSRYELGLAYRDAGEDELAIRELIGASARSRGWAAPAVAGAGILIRAGRLKEAVAAAAKAGALGSDDPRVAVLLALARSARTVDDPGSYAARVLRDLDRMALPPLALLPIRLKMHTLAGQTANIGVLIESALAADESPPGEILLLCANVSRTAVPGMESRCLERYEALYGVTPVLALARARMAAEEGGAERGLATLRELRQAAGESGTTGWDAAEAAYLETHDMRATALEAWKRATEQAPNDPLLLRAALAARSLWEDRSWVREVVDLLRKATDDDCLWWRFYEARRLLSAPEPASADIEAAAKLLKDVTESASGQPEFHLLLASAHERQGRPQEALNDLLIAKRNLNQAVALEIQVARLYQDTGKRAGARDVLQQLLDTEITRSDHLLAIATQLARLGERESVIEILERLAPQSEDPIEIRRRAALYASIGEFERAEGLVNDALAKQEGPKALLLAAALARFGGHTEREDALLERFKAQATEPLARERRLADHFRRVGDLARAEEHLRLVVAMEDVADASDWQGLLACLLLQGKADALLTVWRSPGAQATGALNGETSALEEALLRTAATREDLRHLGAAYVEAEEHRAALGEAIRLLTSFSDAVALSPHALDRLRKLARENPDSARLQLATMKALARSGALQEAVDVGRTAADRDPVSPEPPQLLAHCYRAMGRNDLAADAARQWRSRTLANALEPDLFLAEQSAPERAVALLERYVPLALKRGPAKVLVVYGRALLGLGEHDRLQARLEPYLAKHPDVLRAWIALATTAARHGAVAHARRWLQANPVREASNGQLAVRIALADAWQAVAAADQDEDARARSRLLLTSLTTLGEPSPQAWERIGLIHQANGDAALEEAAYTRAIATSPAPVIALNNLAMIRARAGRPAEALPMAKEFVRRSPRSADAQDTLAFVYQALGDLPATLAALESAKALDPRNAARALSVLEVLLNMGNLSEARRRLQEYRLEYDPTRMPMELRDRWNKLERSLKTKKDG